MTFLDKAEGFFLDLPKPLSAFQIASNYITGVQLFPKDKKIESHFTILLDKGLIEPSFYQNNIKKRDHLSDLFKQELKTFSPKDRRVVFVLPELSQKAFVLAFDKFPAQLKERDQIVKFRIKKQLPLLPDDARIAYSLIPTENKVRVLASVVRASVIKEYEDFFDQLKIKVRSIGIPFVGLVNLIGNEEENVMLANIEEDAFSLVGITFSEISLYRQKSFVFESFDEKSLKQKNDDIALEIENTLNFIEDKEKTKMSTLWVRTGLPGDGDGILSDLTEKLSIQVKGIDSCLPGKLVPNEKRLLSSLLGHIQ